MQEAESTLETEAQREAAFGNTTITLPNVVSSGYSAVREPARSQLWFSATVTARR